MDAVDWIFNVWMLLPLIVVVWFVVKTPLLEYRWLFSMCVVNAVLVLGSIAQNAHEALLKRHDEHWINVAIGFSWLQPVLLALFAWFFSRLLLRAWRQSV